MLHRVIAARNTLASVLSEFSVSCSCQMAWRVQSSAKSFPVCRIQHKLTGNVGIEDIRQCSSVASVGDCENLRSSLDELIIVARCRAHSTSTQQSPRACRRGGGQHEPPQHLEPLWRFRGLHPDRPQPGWNPRILPARHRRHCAPLTHSSADHFRVPSSALRPPPSSASTHLRPSIILSPFLPPSQGVRVCSPSFDSSAPIFHLPLFSAR